MADWGKICADATFGPVLCPNGAYATNLCNVYDGTVPGVANKCTAAAATATSPATIVDPCASDWSACLLDRNWRFCDSFPELCNQDDQGDDHHTHLSFHFNVATINSIICSEDRDRYCAGGE
jgi:hypothetical protein